MSERPSLPEPSVPPTGAGSQARTPWGPISASFATAGVVIFSIVFASLLVSAFGGNEGLRGAGDVLTGSQSAASLQRMLPFLLTWMAISQAVMVGSIWFLSGRFGGQPYRVLALNAPAGGRNAYIMSFLVLGSVLIAYNALGYVLFRQAMLDDLKPFLGMLSGEWWWLTVLVIVIGAPVSEEIAFRGFLFPALAQSRLGIPGAAALSSLGWTFLHTGYSLAGLVEVFLVGVVLAWLTWRGNSLRVAIAAHATYNAVVLLVIANMTLPG
jgi:membrane protease YdiL (CAAX protease family)